MVQFKFKSTKGSQFTIDYEPNGIKITDKPALEKHMIKVADLLECEGKLAKKVERPKVEVKAEVKAEPKPEVKKQEPQDDLFGREGV